MYVYMCVYVCVYMYIYVCVCIYVCIYMYVYMYIYMYIHIHIHVYIHIYIHTSKSTRALQRDITKRGKSSLTLKSRHIMWEPLSMGMHIYSHIVHYKKFIDPWRIFCDVHEHRHKQAESMTIYEFSPQICKKPIWALIWA